MFKFGLLATISVAATLLMIGVGMVVALLPQRIFELSGSMQGVGYIASAFALSYLIVQLPIGLLSDRFGSKYFLLFGYVLCAICGVVFYFSETPEAIYMGRLIQGAGEAPIWALGPAVLALAYPNSKGKAIGIYNAAIHFGLSIGPLAGVFVLTYARPNLPFLVFAGLCFAGAAIVMTLIPRGQKTDCAILAKTPTLKDIVQMIHRPKVRVPLLGVFVYGAGYGIFISVLPVSLAQERGFDQTEISWFFTLFYIAISVAQLIIGPLSDRHGRKTFMVLGLMMVAIGFASFAQLPGSWIYLALICASLGLGIFCVSSLAHLNECVSAAFKSTISGCYYLFWGAGYFLGPMFIGWLSATPQFNQGYVVLALLAAFLTVLIWRMDTAYTLENSASD